MKLSNKILIGFFGFILVYMIVAFTEVRLNGTPTNSIYNSGEIDTINLPEVNYINFHNVNTNFTISSSSEVPPRIEVWSQKGGAASRVKYNIKNDTLNILSVAEGEDDLYQLKISLKPNQLKGLDMADSRVSLVDLEQDSLDISQKNGYFYISNSPAIKHIKIDATPSSSADLNNLDLETAIIISDDASIRVNSEVKHIQGSLKNGSYLYVQSVEDIQFKKDNSSRLNIN